MRLRSPLAETRHSYEARAEQLGRSNMPFRDASLGPRLLLFSGHLARMTSARPFPSFTICCLTSRSAPSTQTSFLELKTSSISPAGWPWTPHVEPAPHQIHLCPHAFSCFISTVIQPVNRHTPRMAHPLFHILNTQDTLPA